MKSTEVGKYVRPLQKTPSRLIRLKSVVTPVPTEISSPKAFNSTGRKTHAPSSSTKVQTKSAAKSVKSCVAKSLGFAIHTNDNVVSSSSETSTIRVKKTKNYDTSLTVKSDEVAEGDQISNKIDTPSKDETKKKSHNSMQSSSENITTVMKVGPREEAEPPTLNPAESSIETNSRRQTIFNVTFSPNKHDEEGTGNVSLGVGLLIPATASVAENHVDTPLNLEKSLIKLNSHRRTTVKATFSPNKHENEENAISINQGDDLLSTTVAPVSECQVDVPQNLLESDRSEQHHQTPLSVTFSPNKHDEKVTGNESLGVGLLNPASATVSESHFVIPLIKLNGTILNATFSPNKHGNEEDAVNVNQGDDLLCTTVAPVSECHEQFHQTPLNITFSPIRHENEEDIANDSLGVGLLSSALVAKRTIDKRLLNSSTPRIGSAKKVVKRLGTPRGDISNQRSFRIHGTRKVSHVHTPKVSKTKFLSAALKERIVDNTKSQQKLVTFNSPTLKGKTPLESRPRLFKFGATTNDGTDAGSSTWQGSVSATKTKLPNFSAIHQKIFQKMESIDETVQRRIERSRALSTKKENQAPTQSSERDKKPVVRKLAASAPPEPPKRILQSRSNRIKLRLERHQNMYKRRSNGGTSAKPSQMLRGVRLNRRFDLQMKFREEQTDQQE